MHVYRIENAEGCGPWHAGSGRDAYNKNHRCRDDSHSCSEPPGPFSEYGTPLKAHFDATDGAGYLFGFKSRAQLKRWFRSMAGRRAMAKAGFRLSLYEVPASKVVAGKWQVAFDRKAAALRGTMDVATLQSTPRRAA